MQTQTDRQTDQTDTLPAMGAPTNAGRHRQTDQTDTLPAMGAPTNADRP